jgi:type I restriction enzyme S subunit
MNQYDRLREAGSQGHISHLNLGYVKQYKISLPAKNEQNIITEILNACDSKIAALDHEACLNEELFRAMLKELMSGRLPAGALAEDAA